MRPLLIAIALLSFSHVDAKKKPKHPVRAAIIIKKEVKLGSMVLRSVNGKALYSDDSASVQDALVAAVKAKTDLTNVDLYGIILSGPDLRGAKMPGAQLYAANIDGALLDNADFTGAMIYASKITNGSLKNVLFVNANLYSADLSTSDTTGAIFKGADMTWCKRK